MVRSFPKLCTLRLAWGLVVALTACGASLAQNAADPESPRKPGESASTAEPATPAVRVEETKPVTYYLKDAEGKLVPVIDMSYEEFIEIYNYRRRLAGPDQPDRFSIQEWTADGWVEDSWAKLDVSIKLAVNVDQWCQVPLGMTEAVLTRPVQHEGPGEYFLSVNRGTGEYVFWVRAGGQSTHRLKLEMLVPLERVLGETRLRLRTPGAVRSSLNLLVDAEEVTATAGDGATLRPVQKRADGKMELPVVGFGEQLQLAWRVDDDRPAMTPAVLEARGSILVKVEGLSGITTTARLKVRSSNGPLDSFHVRLPPDARPVFAKEPGYAIVAADKQRGAANGAANLVQVKILQPTNEEVSIRLEARQQISATQGDAEVEVGLWEVVDAVRQAGTIAVQVTGNAEVTWLEGDGVVRVDELPEPLAKESFVAAFEYSQQPSSLKLRVGRRTTRVSVEPRYVVRVGSDGLHLAAELNYEVRGATADSLELLLPDWDLEEDVAPASLVKVDAVRLESDSPLKIPLLRPMRGRFTIELRARDPLDPMQEEISFRLPQTVANMVSGASLIVLADDNVRLTPYPEKIQGLQIDQNPPQVDLPRRTQEPLYFQVTNGSEEARFEGKIEILPRRVYVEQFSRVTIDPGWARVEQRLSYRIAHEPLDHLLLQIPKEILRVDELSILRDGSPLEPDFLPLEEPNGDSGGFLQMRVPLAASRVGLCELIVRYAVPLPGTPRGNMLSPVLPLFIPVFEEPVPAEGDAPFVYLGHTLTVPPVGGLQLQPLPSPWTVQEVPETEGDSEARFAAPRPVPSLQLRLALAGAPDGAATVVRQAWVQTWLSRGDGGGWFPRYDRRDRVSFRVRTAARQIQIRLPAGVDAKQVDLFVNGAPLPVPSDAGPELVIELSGDYERPEYLLELWYPVTADGIARGQMSFELPQIVGAAFVKRMYWQLVMPRNEELLAGPEKLTPEMTWHWYGVRWGSRPRLDNDELESWMDTSRSEELPAATNQYLFSCFRPVAEVQVTTAARSLLVLSASGLILISGLLLIYLPVLRRPWLLLGIVILFAFGVLAYPELTVFAAQSAALGIGLVVLARLLYWLLVQRRMARGVLHGTSVFPVEGSTTETQRRRTEGSSHGDSATVPAIPAVPAPDVDSTASRGATE
jgi:hypothetical protein